MRIDVLTLFPAMMAGPLDESIVQRARARGLVEIAIHDIRAWATDRHRTADDYPYGGGAGMVLKPAPVVAAVEAVRASADPAARLLLMGAGGRPFTQALAADLAVCSQLILLCGHYEGFDQRILDLLQPEEISIGDYVLTGGELPAMVVIDSVVRLLPGAIDATSTADESFTTGLLEYPHYTRPAQFRGLAVPDVLLSGHHANIERWRRDQALRRTLAQRPDLLATAPLTPADQRRLAALRAEAAGAAPTVGAGQAVTPSRIPPPAPSSVPDVATAYASDADLAARQSIYAWRRPPLDFHGWALDQARWTGGETVLDVGCGNGRALHRLVTRPAPPARLLGIDRSAGMLAAARQHWPPAAPVPPLVAADAVALPLADAACDTVLAMHMLYHVPDLAATLVELRRVLRPGGQLLATTNGQDHLAELAELLCAATAAVTGDTTAIQAGLALGFDLDSGAGPLRAAFDTVERRDAIGQLVITVAPPVVAYAASMIDLLPALPDPAAWPAILADLERRIADVFARHGALRLTTHAGVFLCQ
ncbi:MAG: tRNA (guanosine(37)-N1)-methyltransferase TrmD [Chloroflexi bacterium]|nr:tRNA (guanosine(37)-N1)-methyltransferase TrmD [Chloroflexota bacterium]